MVSEVTRNIKVSVESFYHDKNDEQIGFLFPYRVTIVNEGNTTVKLISRHWFIWDGFLKLNEVEGEGVIGEQPILTPGSRHQYVSGCHLEADIGQMHGTYLMLDVETNNKFYVNIPAFTQTAPYLLN